MIERENTGEFYPTLDLRILEPFTLPYSDPDEEERLFAELEEKVPKKHKIALVIGRFQPLHYGHIYLIKQSLCLAENVIIGIGSANIKNIDNPFSSEQREEMLKKALEREQLSHRVLNIVRLNDYYNDDTLWLEETVRKTGTVDIVVGNNDWVNGIFKNAGFKTQEVPLIKRDAYQGTTIRAFLRGNGFHI